MSRALVFLVMLGALSSWSGVVLAQQPVATPAAASVIVEWSTESEVGLAGFNLYRSEDPEGSYVKLNDALIPPSPDPFVGGRYVYTDTAVIAGVTYYYKLEHVELDGTSTMHGPIEVVGTVHTSPLGFDIARIVLIVLLLGLVGATAFVLVARRRARKPAPSHSSVESGRREAGR